MPIKEILQPLLETYKSGLETGDLEQTLYAAKYAAKYAATTPMRSALNYLN